MSAKIFKARHAMGPTVRGPGAFIEYLAWTVGIGAGIATLLSRRRAVVPPPLPTWYRA